MLPWGCANIVGGKMESALVNGRYELGRRLGGGAFCDVYQARDLGEGGVPRALKVLRAGAGRPSGRELMWEFERLGRLEHPHLVRAHDLDLARAGALPGGVLFLVEDLVDGEPCDHALARLDPAARTSALVRLLAEAGSALGYLH